MKKTVLVTGSEGFVGRNLILKLKELGRYRVFTYDIENTDEELRNYLSEADVVYHLAGVNRPKDESEFSKVNTGLTSKLVSILNETGHKPKILFSSSTQAEYDNPYGISKRKAEEQLTEFSLKSGCPVRIYRFTNVFGKWCRPNYNSAIATFCHNIARDLPITINNPESVVNLIYIDDIVKEFISQTENDDLSVYSDIQYIKPVFSKSLREISDALYSFRKMRNTLLLPDLSDKFIKYLYSTYLSYLPEDDFGYDLEKHSDNRGCLSELFKSENSGQVFVSTTKPGITRGNHYHHTKTEKFCVLSGDAVIRFRKIDSATFLSYKVNGNTPRIIDIPPGYTHSIENTGSEDMVVLFWSSELFSQENPDTYPLKVEYEEEITI